MEWGEAGRMPLEIFRCFQESSKFKVFGGGNKVCFSAKRVGRLALWESNEKAKEEWSGLIMFQAMVTGCIVDSCLMLDLMLHLNGGL